MQEGVPSYPTRVDPCRRLLVSGKPLRPARREHLGLFPEHHESKGGIDPSFSPASLQDDVAATLAQRFKTWTLGPTALGELAYANVLERES